MSDDAGVGESSATPEGYPHDWTFNVVLRDGTTIGLRPILPGDGDGLQRLVSNMSVDSVYQRFFRVKTRWSPRRFTTSRTWTTGIEWRSWPLMMAS